MIDSWLLSKPSIISQTFELRIWSCQQFTFILFIVHYSVLVSVKYVAFLQVCMSFVTIWHFLCMTCSCNLYRTWIGGVAICQVISCPYVKLCSSHSFCCLSTFCSWLSLSLVCSIAQWTIVELFDLAWNCETSFTIMKTILTRLISLYGLLPDISLSLLRIKSKPVIIHCCGQSIPIDSYIFSWLQVWYQWQACATSWIASLNGIFTLENLMQMFALN